MKLIKTERIFIGLKVDSKLRESLHFCPPGGRKYFEDASDDFLKVCIHENEKWLGKVVKGGLGVNDVSNLERNVISILRRIAPSVRNTSASLKIFAVSDEDVGHVKIFDKKKDEASDGPSIEY